MSSEFTFISYAISVCILQWKSSIYANYIPMGMFFISSGLCSALCITAFIPCNPGLWITFSLLAELNLSLGVQFIGCLDHKLKKRTQEITKKHILCNRLLHKPIMSQILKSYLDKLGESQVNSRNMFQSVVRLFTNNIHTVYTQHPIAGSFVPYGPNPQRVLQWHLWKGADPGWVLRVSCGDTSRGSIGSPLEGP